MWKAGEPVSLSPTEFTLLRYFVINAGTVLSKPKILDHVWRYDFGGDVNVVQVVCHICARKIDTGELRLLHAARCRLRAAGAAVIRRPPPPGRTIRAMRQLPPRGAAAGGLVAAMLLLVGCGLLASGVAVTSALRHDLVNRVDQTLIDASNSWAAGPAPDAAARRGPQPGPAAVELLRPRRRHRRQPVDGRQRPRVPNRRPEDNNVGPPVTIESLNGSPIQWRAVSVRRPNGS